MKKTIFLTLSLMGMASASPIINDDGSVQIKGDTYAYLWTGNGANSNFTNADNWKYLPTPQTSGEMSGPTQSYYPNGVNDAFIGYDYNAVTGTFTKNDSAITVSDWKSTYGGNLFLGDNASFAFDGYQKDMSAATTIHMGAHSNFRITGGDAGIKSNITFDLGNIGSYTGSIACEASRLWLNASSGLTFSGSYTMDAAFFQRELMSITSSQFDGGSIESIIHGADLAIAGFENENLTYAGVIADVSELQDNQYALLWKDNAVTLVARDDSFAPIPEPATATLGMLGAALFCLRRRRK